MPQIRTGTNWIWGDVSFLIKKICDSKETLKFCNNRLIHYRIDHPNIDGRIFDAIKDEIGLGLEQLHRRSEYDINLEHDPSDSG